MTTTANDKADTQAAQVRASVVILNFNYAEFLSQCIESALTQTVRETEVIVVDDGSTDSSRRLIAGYDQRVVAVYKDNGGMHTAMNAGFAASHGEMVLFLDADDLLLPFAVERALSTLHVPGVVKSHWPMRLVDAQGNWALKLVPRYSLSEGDLLEAVIHDGPDACHSAPTSGNAWSRSFLNRVMPIRDGRFKRHAEVYLGTLAPVFGRLMRMKEPLGSYRVHGRNDYASASIRERNQRNLALYEARCDALAAALQVGGKQFDRTRWTDGRNAYLWMEELESVVERLMKPGSNFILVDDNQWPQAVVGRRTIRFLEKDGVYWGPPINSAEAGREFQRLLRAGANFLVLAWPCFWWRESYREFCRHLEQHFHCVHRSDCLVVFDLKSPAHH